MAGVKVWVIVTCAERAGEMVQLRVAGEPYCTVSGATRLVTRCVSKLVPASARVLLGREGGGGLIVVCSGAGGWDRDALCILERSNCCSFLKSHFVGDKYNNLQYSAQMSVLISLA